MSDRDRRLHFKPWMFLVGIVTGLAVTIVMWEVWGWSYSTIAGVLFGALGVLMVAEAAGQGDRE